MPASEIVTPSTSTSVTRMPFSGNVQPGRPVAPSLAEATPRIASRRISVELP